MLCVAGIRRCLLSRLFFVHWHIRRRLRLGSRTTVAMSCSAARGPNGSACRSRFSASPATPRSLRSACCSGGATKTANRWITTAFVMLAIVVAGASAVVHRRASVGDRRLLQILPRGGYVRHPHRHRRSGRRGQERYLRTCSSANWPSPTRADGASPANFIRPSLHIALDRHSVIAPFAARGVWRRDTVAAAPDRRPTLVSFQIVPG